MYELSTICWVRFGRRPSSATIKLLLAEQPPAPRTTRRFPVFHVMPNPVDRRLAVLRLHAEGWNTNSIAGYLETSRFTVYDVLHRWCARVQRSRLDRFVKAGRTICKHRDGILTAIRLGLTNARLEGLNQRVRLIVRRAFGFHAAHAALALVMLSCGPVTLTLP